MQISSKPFCAAYNRGTVPLEVGVLMFAPWSQKVSTAQIAYLFMATKNGDTSLRLSSSLKILASFFKSISVNFLLS